MLIHLAYCISSMWPQESLVCPHAPSPHTHYKPDTTIQSPMTSTIRDSWRMTHNAVQPCLQRGRLLIFPLFFLPPQPPHSSVPTPSQPPNLLTIHKSWACVYIFPASKRWHMTNQSSNKQLVLNNFPPTTTKGWKINKSLSVWPGQVIW